MDFGKNKVVARQVNPWLVKDNTAYVDPNHRIKVLDDKDMDVRKLFPPDGYRQ